MVVVKYQVKDNVLLFLFYLLRHYASTASQIVQSTQAKFDKLMPKMRKSFHWNVDKFTTYISVLLVTLAENEGNDNLVSELIYTLPTKSLCSLLNSEIVVYKHINLSTLDVHKILIKARE